MKKILFIILLFSSLIGFGQTTYYFKDGGNDGNTGLSDAQAWATIAKISGKAFSAGDSILLKRGDTWNVSREGTNLNLTESGTLANPIVISTYGSGAKPIITGRDTIPGWSGPGNWTNSSGNVWYLTNAQFITGLLTRVWINGTAKKTATSTTVIANTPWFSSSGKLYVYSVGNPATTYTLIEYAGNPARRCIQINDGNYIHIHNLDLRGAYHNIQILNGGIGIEIDSCLIGRDVAQMGIYVRSEIGDIASDGKIYNCIFDSGDTLKHDHSVSAPNDGINLFGGHNWQIYNNRFKNWSHSELGLNVYLVSGIAGHDSIFIHDNFFTSPDIDYGRALDLNTGSDGANIFVYHNLIYNVPTCNQISGSGIDFYYNIIDSVTRPSWSSDEIQGAGLVISDYDEGEVPTNINIFNNTIVNCYDYGIDIISYKGAAGGVTGVNISNNLFSGNGSSAEALDYQIWVEDDTYISDVTFRNNLLYSSGVTDLIYYGHSSTNDYPHTIAEFNSENGTAGDVISGNVGGNPNFVSSTDFNLQTGSSAINVGVNVGLTSDYRGYNLVGLPDIGAYEWSASGSVSSTKVGTYHKKIVAHHIDQVRY